MIRISSERICKEICNGGIRRLQRHGLKTDGNYGKIDNLHISYNGNRITTVLEDADPVTQSGSMDYPGEKREMSFGYNDWGALVKGGVGAGPTWSAAGSRRSIQTVWGVGRMHFQMTGEGEYRMGRRSTTFCLRTYNKACCFIDAFEVGIRRCKSLLK